MDQRPHINWASGSEARFSPGTLTEAIVNKSAAARSLPRSSAEAVGSAACCPAERAVDSAARRAATRSSGLKAAEASTAPAAGTMRAAVSPVRTSAIKRPMPAASKRVSAPAQGPSAAAWHAAPKAPTTMAPSDTVARTPVASACTMKSVPRTPMAAMGVFRRKRVLSASVAAPEIDRLVPCSRRRRISLASGLSRS